MSLHQDRTSVSRQVELILRRLTSLSTAPEVVSCYLSALGSGPVQLESLTHVVEGDPALSAQILSLAARKQIRFTENGPSVAQTIAELPEEQLREALLEVKAFSSVPVEPGGAGPRLPHRELVIHCVATACASQAIAEFVLAPEQRSSAYYAGLLHDIGKLALCEVMPKSLEHMVAEAQSLHVSLARVEQQRLGLDHATLGKKLAQRWGLPHEITMAIWLQRTDLQAIGTHMPEGRLAQVVALGNLLARQSQLGMCGNGDAVGEAGPLCESLGLSSEQLSQIRISLRDRVRDRIGVPGLEAPSCRSCYEQAIHETAQRAVREIGPLLEQNRRYQQQLASHRFLRDLLSDSVGRRTTGDWLCDVADSWQTAFKTGIIHVYIVYRTTNVAQIATLVPGHPVDLRVVSGSAVAEAMPFGSDETEPAAAQGVRRCLDRWELALDRRRLESVSLALPAECMGAVAFERGGPDSTPGQWQEAGQMAGHLLGMSLAGQEDAGLAEQFVDILSESGQAREDRQQSESLEILAELAAGAAHELNNPLSVISGRAQVLYNGESDPDKKRMLQQIQQRSEDLTGIVQDLMTFARPRCPAPRLSGVPQIVEAAIGQITANSQWDRHLFRMHALDQVPDVWVDPQQITQALSYILENAAQSYPHSPGAVHIRAAQTGPVHFVLLQVVDQGRGMDPSTLDKVCHPFFSGRDAGRRRGMGLAHAQRLIGLNQGTLTLESRLGEGTTVTVSLPRPRP